MSNVPVATALQERFIIDPTGIVIVNVPLCPAIVPDTIMVPPPWPANWIDAENVEPLCVICHVIPFIIEVVRPAPIMVPLESDAAPAHVPVRLEEETGAVGATGFRDEVEVLPQAAVQRAVETAKMMMGSARMKETCCWNPAQHRTFLPVMHKPFRAPVRAQRTWGGVCLDRRSGSRHRHISRIRQRPNVKDIRYGLRSRNPASH